MKILLINKFFYLRGGAERHLFDLGEILKKKGHQVAFFSTLYNSKIKNFAEYSDLSKREGIFRDLQKIGRIFWNREASKKLEKIIKKEKPDLAHLHNIFGHLSPSIIYTLKKHNISVILTLHDYKLFYPSFTFRNSFSRNLIDFLEAIWLKNILKIDRKIDIFIAPSRFLRKIAIERGIAEEKIVFVPNFIFLDKFRNLGHTGANASGKYFLYFGRLSEEKGVDLLIKTFLKFSKKNSDWKLKIAGEGPQKKELEKLSRNNNKIEFLGKRNIKELKTLIKNSFAIVLPSVWPENMPYSALESMAMSKAIIATNIGGLPQLTNKKKNGVLFKCADREDLLKKLIWAVRNPVKIKKMGRNARKEIVEKYNSEKYYESVMEVYKNLTSVILEGVR